VSRHVAFNLDRISTTTVHKDRSLTNSNIGENLQTYWVFQSHVTHLGQQEIWCLCCDVGEGRTKFLSRIKLLQGQYHV